MHEDPHHAADDQASPQGAAPVRVLAAVIMENGRYLVGLRPEHKRYGGLWEFPGGKVGFGETLLDAARRELKEELGVDVVAAGDPVFIRQDPGSIFVIEFTEVQIVGSPEAREHEKVRWATLKDLLVLRLAPSDRAFAEELSKCESATIHMTTKD